MMGKHDRAESLFYYFRIEDHVPENHLLRLIDRHVSFAFVQEKLKSFYSEAGRPSIDPELLLRILLIGYLYGVTSERKLVQELSMHLAWRWFTGLNFDQTVPHHSTFSKNRHGRFQDSDIFREIFEQIVARCTEAGLVRGDDVSVDGSFVEANAGRSSGIPREQLQEAAQVKRTVRQYLADLAEENPAEGFSVRQDRVSTTDPDAAYFTKGDRAARLGYLDNYLIDNHSCVVLDVQATAASLSRESIAARAMLARSAARRGACPQSIAADAGYGTGEFLEWLEEKGITPFIPIRKPPTSAATHYGTEKFTYEQNTNTYVCPEGKELKYIGVKEANHSHVYRATIKKCRDCPQKASCTGGRYRQIVVHIHEAARQRARERAVLPSFAAAQRQRRKIEALFGELKNQIGLRKLRLRGMKHVQEQFLLAATAQNLKRLVRFLDREAKHAAPVPAL